jgi:Putative addiction module component
MQPSDTDIEQAALRLEPTARARLAERLLRSLDELSEAEAAALWAEEAERRDAELDAGDEIAVPASEVFRNARANLG